MSAKLIYSLTDTENPDLEKQIGCMNGFFQLFDRHRRIAAHGHTQPQKRLPPPPGQNGNQAVEANNRLEKATGKDSKKVVKEKRRNSTESSRHSISSSSCSSSFSSLDYNKTANPEPSPSSQNSSSETPSRDFSVNQPNVSTQFTRKPVDLRDVIKDSMRREARGLSVKTAAKEAAVVRTLKYIDSPRPLEAPKSAKPKNYGANDSFRVFPKFREGGPLSSNEEKDVRTVWAPRDFRRLSYDGRESHDTLKTTIKLKELPRLSLDSRQGCIRSSIAEAKPSYHLNDLRIERRNGSETANLLQEPGSSKRASSVVAKLMGLVEPMPIVDDSIRLDNSLEAEKNDPLSKSSRTVKVNKHDQFPGSPKSSQRELNSPRLRNADSARKTSANQKFPIETAPWRQQHGNRNRGPQTPAFKSQEAPVKIATTPLTVYGEIEKRLADLEFKKSGKDLRALKQILEAMQKTKDASDDRKDEKLASQANDHDSLDYCSDLVSQRNLRCNSSVPPTAQGSKALVSNKSPIVIMKPAKLMGRSTGSVSAVGSIDNAVDLEKHDSADNRKVSVERRTTKHPTARNTRTTKSPQSSKMLESEENSGGSGRISGTTSPRLLQRRLVLDKQSSPASPSDTSSRRRQSSRQPTECSSPGRKFKPKSSNTQRSNDQLSDTRTEGNTNSLQSESNVSLASEDIDNEVTSIYFEQNRRNQKNPTYRKVAEPGRATPEQPSPISVLDANFYRDDSPSPVKKTSNAFKDDEIPYPDEAEWELLDAMEPTVAESLLCESTNPDHIYISDILMASDFPRKLEYGWMNVPLNSSRHLINPKLFFALEQRSEKILHPKPDKTINRKLIFDVVNEILIRKLVVTDSFTQWLTPEKLTRREPRGQQLFRELCSEVDRLQGKASGGSVDGEEDSLTSIICDDMTKWPMSLAEYGREIPAVVLDVERLIFKDLITEIVNGEAAGWHGGSGGSGGHCRKLF